MGKSVHVVLLAGGYSTVIAQGVSVAAEAAGSPGKLTGALAAATSMGSAVVPALLPLDGAPALVRLLKALKAVRRITLAAVWVVHNESDTARIMGPGGLFGPSPASDLGLPAVNFLSNGASGPDNWRGETADFRSALAAILKSGSSDACVAGISCTLAFMPNYNLQRLLEHSYLRNRDVLGFSLLNGVDVALLGSQGHLETVPGDDLALPRLERLRPLSDVSPGAKVAEPYLFLRPETAAAVASGAGGPSGWLQGLGSGLMEAGTYIAGIDLMFGRYNLRTAEAADYADRFFAFCSTAATDPAKVGLKPDAVLRPYDTNPGGTQPELPPVPAAGSFIGRSTAANFRFDVLDGTAKSDSALHGTDYEAFTKMAAAFNSRFFGDAATSKAAAAGMKHYLLPPTFYMTAYRRQGADIML
ncbi:hypothetical protein VOLCADRAFT_103356 [Volvox carteri f. nagariensis]|uniref:Uncharacterized protein n=1 Tax=Volvox carteri f. nagariensis TaxID=3068 RepID=D8TLE5_VOLCA|nr:uncharacterized protein VOLCADRAFT_103356 [Volvox carteri f. nagariensis]EFJ51720.1 hypothetical protein VOLCADRAFT_103356 [Volvox carteri f. nagariensis]|eukprot:XP_002947130.1 hypothetical protein VOLCADRAFT_103356 [Volvox carteri f. nagariensis]